LCLKPFKPRRYLHGMLFLKEQKAILDIVWKSCFRVFLATDGDRHGLEKTIFPRLPIPLEMPGKALPAAHE